MRKFSLVLFLVSTFSWAQINYVALVKDADGEPVSNSNVDIKISIVDYTDESSVYYSESHSTSTTADGIVRLSIGEGNVISGDFQMIDWSKKLAIIDAYDLDGNGYTIGGKELIRSVPTSEYSNKVEGLELKYSDYTVILGSEVENDSVYFSTILGYKAGIKIKGSDNVIIGNSSGQNLKGNQNIAIGSRSLFGNPENNNTAEGNTAIGHSSMYSNETGYHNTALGWTTLPVNTSGFENTSIGAHTMAVNTTGKVNTALGRAALHWNKGGNDNTALGSVSLFANTDGSNNTAVGVGALNNVEEDNNVGVGYFSGTGLISGTMNTAIGYRSNLKNNIQNSTALGANAVVTTSNTIQLGDSNVDLINTSATVSASAFQGNGNSITITESGTILSLLEIIQELRQKIESLEKTVSKTGIYLSENGITVKCEQAAVGFKQEVNGKLYRVVDRQTLIDLVTDGKNGAEVDFTCLCTSRVEDFSTIFENYTSFNQDISSWDLSNATTTESMFFSAKEFNQDIGAWDMSGVVNMGTMFTDADKFNQDIRRI